MNGPDGHPAMLFGFGQSRPGQRYDLYGSPLLQRSTWSDRLPWSSTNTAHRAAGHIEGALAAAERTVESITASNRIEPTR